MNEKKEFTILGFTIWRFLIYFIIYSIAGFIIETIYGMITKGVIESRQGFLYGPVCPIYGVGSVVIILALQYFKKNNYTLFLGGFLVGSIVEYLVSFIGELLFNIKWWDYSDEPFNIGGRICIYFSIFWGILAIYLITHLHPKVDKMIDWIEEKISLKKLKIIVAILSILLLIDLILTAISLKIFFSRLTYNYDLDLLNKETYINQYEEIIKNEKVKNLTEKYFSDKKMLKTFPNLKLNDKDGNIIFVKDLLTDITPYYYKIYDKR